jgi:hypothetical protein
VWSCSPARSRPRWRTEPARAFKTAGCGPGHDGGIHPRTKIAIAVRDDLAGWQRLNVSAFLVSGVAARYPETVGEDYEDASGRRYLPMFGQPVLVYAGDADSLRAAHRKAIERDIAVAVYTEELFATGNDDDNRAAVRSVRPRSCPWSVSRFTVSGTRSTRP